MAVESRQDEYFDGMETMAVAERENYLNRKLSETVDHAYRLATAVKKLYKDGGVSPAQFKKLQGSGAVILDIRNDKDVKKGIIPGSKNIPLNKLEGSLGSLSKGKKIVVYCNSGPIAAIGYTILKQNGFKDVNYLAARVRFKKGKLSSIK